MIKIAILGLGSRGALFADYLKEMPDVEIVAVVDVLSSQLELARKNYNVKEEMCFRDYRDFYALGKVADGVIIATQDKDHYNHIMPALKLKYHVLLEKPIATTPKDCVEIATEANRNGCRIMVCHVLRYAHFYAYLKNIIDSGEIGRVVTVNQTENVGYWHYAHSFIRGPWKNSDSSSPMILAKCCHDLDILSYLIGDDCESVSSFGSLTYFRPENAPEGSGEFCYRCALRDTCIFNGKKIYSDRNWMVLGSRSQLDVSDMKELDEKLSDESNPFSRCVFRSDNNVVDHQVVNLLYKNGATAHLTMTAFSEECTRTVKVHGTKGEVEGDMEKKKLRLTVFGKGSREIDLTELGLDFHCHGGGDRKLIGDFVDMLKGKTDIAALTTIDKSVESHMIAFAAEESRLTGKTVQL